MEHKDIYDLLKTLNIPVAYDHFDSNKNEIELVTEKKDVELEKAIEELLTNNKIPYDVENEVWDEDERIYHNFYEI